MTTASTATRTATYRKTRQGDWVACAPAAALRAGAWVTVIRRDGTRKDEPIARVGRPFMADGVEMAYGYIDQARAARPAGGTRRNTWQGSYSCDDCQAVEDMGDCQGCGRHRGNPRN